MTLCGIGLYVSGLETSGTGTCKEVAENIGKSVFEVSTGCLESFRR
jgi:hypothetical protein